MAKALTEYEFNWLVKRRSDVVVSDIDVLTKPLSDQERYELNIMRYKRAVGIPYDEPVVSIADHIIFELNKDAYPSIGDIHLFKFNESNVRRLSTA